MAPRTDWNPILRTEFDKPYWSELQQFVATERSRHTVYPAHDDVFAAFHLTPFADVKVLILGQDPYHGPTRLRGLLLGATGYPDSAVAPEHSQGVGRRRRNRAT